MSGDLRTCWRDAIKASTLKPTTRLVALVLADYWKSRRPDETWCAEQTLAEQTGLGVSTVRAALSTLTQDGWIEVTQPRRQHRSPRYRLTLTAESWRSEQPDRQISAARPPDPGGDTKRTPLVLVQSASSAKPADETPPKPGWVNWREADRRIFGELLADRLHPDDIEPTYQRLRANNKDWPGRWLTRIHETGDLDGWLANYGPDCYETESEATAW